MKTWIVQFGIWLKLSWPIARTLWSVLYDGRLELREVLDAITGDWPTDAEGRPVAIELPWARWFRERG